MADEKDLELEGEDPSAGSSSQSVRKNIALKLTKSPAKSNKPKGRRGKQSKKVAKKIEKEESETQERAVEVVDDMDILEEVQFASMKMTGSGSQEPVHKDRKLNWDHKVNLIGEKVVDPLIHCCGNCGLPILIYGRMIPCKHVFCFDCAKQTEKNCPRSGCGDPVTRIEQSALGTVFICTFGGSKHGMNGCQRTYLSQRDLQAHISHRHLRNQLTSSHSGSTQDSRNAPPPPLQTQVEYMPRGVGNLSSSQADPVPSQTQPIHDLSINLYHQPPPPPLHGTPLLLPPQSGHPPVSHLPNHPHPPPQGPQTPSVPPTMQPLPQTRLPPPSVTSHIESYHTIPVMSTSRTNLITVPLQDEGDYQHRDNNYTTQPPTNPAYPPPTGPPSHFPPNTSHPPPPVSFSSVPPPYSSSGHPSPHQGPPSLTGPPPMTSAPPLCGGPPQSGLMCPAISSHVPPQRFSHYEEYNTNNPRPHWPQSGPPTPIGPPPSRPPSNNNQSMGPPPRPYYQ